MSSVITAAKWRRVTLLSSGLLIPFSLGIAPSLAQQSASPDLLPPVTISPSERARPAAPVRATRSRRAARTPAPKPAPVENAAPIPGPSAANLFPTVVVSPTGVATPANEVASSVTVITARDIEIQQRRTVPDALASVPGLNIVQAGGPGGQTSVFMRGTNSNHTKVLIDGIDVSDPSNLNRSFDFGQLQTTDIQQIEVLRGPQSGLYGADAIGGVISIITRKGEGPPRTTAMIEAGSHGTFNQAVGVSGGQDRIDYAFNVSHLRALDTPVTPTELLPPGRQAIGNYYDNMTYSTKLGADVTEDFRLNGVVRYTDATHRFTGDEFDPVTFASAPAAAQSTQTVHQLFTRGEGVWSVLDGRIKSYFGVNYTDHWNYSIAPGDPSATITTGDRIKYDWRSVVALAPAHSLIVGADHETERMQTSSLSASNTNRGVFAELQSQFFDRVFLVGNVRTDDNERFGDHATYRIAPSVIVPVTETKLKASYGTGFKAPTLNQLFVSFPSFNFFANPNLKPEESSGYDAGFEQPLFHNRVRFGSTYFHNDITDLINSGTGADGAGRVFFTNVNVGQATTEGTESFVAATITDRIRVRADYTFTRAIDATTGLELLRRPKEKWSAAAYWNPIDALTLSATVLHVGEFVDGNRDFSIPRLKAPGYTIVNLAGDYRLDDQIKLFARIDNVADVRYQNPTGFLQPGLGVFGGVRMASSGVR